MGELDGSASAIRFHRLTDEYGCFTNFARYPIVFDGAIWPTSEHYFQAQKFRHTDAADRIRACSTPSGAARLGRSREVPIRQDWAEVRVQVMRHAVSGKFQQHPRLAARLLATGDRELVEDSRSDDFWGAGRDGTGRNVNGRIVMEVRAQLRAGLSGRIAAVQEVHRRLPHLEGRPWVLFAGGVLVSPPRRMTGATVVAAAELLVAVASDGTRDAHADGNIHVLTPDASSDGAAETKRAARGREALIVHEPRDPERSIAASASR